MITTRQNVLTALIRVCAAWLLFTSSAVDAVELIPAGSHAKVGAGAGQTLSRGSTALFHNPANLIYGKFIEPFLDVSYVNANYSFLAADEQFDLVEVPIATPAASAGLSVRPTPGFALGVAVLPTGDGSILRVEGVPLELIPGTTQLFDVESEENSYQIAAGAAIRFGYAFALGAGVIRHRELSAFRLFDPKNGEDADATVDAQFEATTYQFSGGFRSELFDRALVIAGSYRSGSPVNYVGDIIHPQSEGQFVEYEGVGYLPQAIGAGLEFRYASFGAFLDFVYEVYTPARQTVRQGLPTDPLEVDLLDTFNGVVGIKFWFAKYNQIILAGGYNSSYIGDGSGPIEEIAQDEEIVGDGSIGGVQFGDIDAIAKIRGAAGYRLKITGHGYFQGGLQYMTGTRDVPIDAPGEGFYQFTAFVGTLGLAFGF